MKILAFFLEKIYPVRAEITLISFYLCCGLTNLNHSHRENGPGSMALKLCPFTIL